LCCLNAEGHEARIVHERLTVYTAIAVEFDIRANCGAEELIHMFFSLTVTIAAEQLRQKKNRFQDELFIEGAVSGRSGNIRKG